MLAWLAGTLVALLLLAAALYFLFPGVVYRAAMALARRSAGLVQRETEIDGHRVPYLEGGSGEPLLLLHGFGANKDHWTFVAPFLTRHFHVYAPDLPGFGDADRLADKAYGLDAMLARIGEFADRMGLDSFDLAGNSMGGYLATLFAHRAPDRVRSLWLLAPAGAAGAEPSETLRLIEQGDNPLIMSDVAGFERLTRLCFEVPPPMPAQFRRPLLERARREAAFNARIFEELFADPLPLEGTVDGLATRALVVWGDNDRVLHPSGLGILGELLANAECVLMARMGHVPMIERPAEAAADYLRFRGIEGAEKAS